MMVECRKHATRTAAENIEDGRCLSWMFDQFACDLTEVDSEVSE